MRLGQADRALADAQVCRELRPDWQKAWYREGSALRLMQVCSSYNLKNVAEFFFNRKLKVTLLSFSLLQKFEEAANAFYSGVQLNPENMELVQAFR